jgi:hypothetical protein
MVVQLDCPPFVGRFVLKLYDRRFATQLRLDEEASPWSSQIEFEYSVFVRGGRASKFFDLCTAKYREYEYWPYEDREEWNMAEHEAHLQYLCHRTYQTETNAYKKMHDIQGKHVPRLFARPFLQSSDSGLASKYLDHPGILLEYIQGFPLTNLADETPMKNWQYVCEDAIRIVHMIGDRGICNKDVKTRSFIVCEDPGTEKFKVFMTDFGLCLFRSRAKNDREFNGWQALEDEESAVGHAMKKKLEGGFKFYRSSRSEKLMNEFKSEDSDVCYIQVTTLKGSHRRDDWAGWHNRHYYES